MVAEQKLSSALASMEEEKALKAMLEVTFDAEREEHKQAVANAKKAGEERDSIQAELLLTKDKLADPEFLESAFKGLPSFVAF